MCDLRSLASLTVRLVSPVWLATHILNLRAHATAADTRGYMGSRYELHWSVLGVRDLKAFLKRIIENH